MDMFRDIYSQWLEYQSSVPDVDCVLSEWSGWVVDEESFGACINNEQTGTETRTRTVITPRSGNGAACGALEESRPVTRACETTSQFVVAKPLNVQSVNYSAGGNDLVDINKQKPALPWTTFVDGSRTIAESAEGVAVDNRFGFRLLHVYGAFNALYHRIPNLFDVNGTPEIWQSLTEWGGGGPAIIPGLNTSWASVANPAPAIPYPLTGGTRDAAIMTPYTTIHAHTRRRFDGTLNTGNHVPFAIGLVMNGTLLFYRRSGDIIVHSVLPHTTGGYTNDFTFFNPDPINRPTDIEIFFYTDTTDARRRGRSRRRQLALGSLLRSARSRARTRSIA
jgi:hypothetical protein